MHCNSYRTTTSQLQADYELVDGASEVRRLRLVTNPLSLIMAAAISTMWATYCRCRWRPCVPVLAKLRSDDLQKCNDRWLPTTPDTLRNAAQNLDIQYAKRNDRTAPAVNAQKKVNTGGLDGTLHLFRRRRKKNENYFHYSTNLHRDALEIFFDIFFSSISY